MSYFQDGGHDVLPPFAAVYAAASAGGPIARQARKKVKG